MPTWSLDTSAARGSFSDKNVGHAKAVSTEGYALLGADAGNYELQQPGGLSADITPATLLLRGSAGVDKTADGRTALPAGTRGFEMVGLLGSDQVTAGGSAVYDGASVGPHAVQQGSLALSGVDAANYLLAWSDGSGTIAKARDVLPPVRVPNGGADGGGHRGDGLDRRSPLGNDDGADPRGNDDGSGPGRQ